MVRRLAVLLFVASPLFAAPSPNSPQTKSFQAKVVVNGNCTISTLPTLDFTTYDPLSTNAASAQPGTTSITFKCTRGSHPLISLDKGQNGTATQRAMSNGGSGSNNSLNYNLVQPDSSGNCAATNTAWGDGSGLGSKLDFGVTTVGPLASQSVTICGYIPGAQDANAGSYTDNVTASVEF